MNTSGLLPESTTTFDITPAIGAATEYRVDHKYDSSSLANSTYISVASDLSAVHDRGDFLLVVDDSVIEDLDLDTLKRDLAGDGWTVYSVSVPRADVPRYVPTATEIAAGFDTLSAYTAWNDAVFETKAAIRAVYDDTEGRLKAALLVGHVAVPYSGYASDDGHNFSGVGVHGGATPADIYYGDMGDDADWTDTLTFSGTDAPQNNNFAGDGKFDNDALPIDHQLNVGIGRVDFSLLTSYDIPVSTLSPPTPLSAASTEEIALLQNYFDREHEWRTGSVEVERQAAYNIRADWYGNGDFGLIENRLTANVGSDNLHFETWADEDVPAGVQDDSYLWGIAEGGGVAAGQNFYAPQDGDAIGTVSSLTNPHTIFLGARDFADTADSADANQVVFKQIFGSYVGDWDKQNSLLLGSIAQSGGLGLATMYAGRPKWEAHTMAIGESFADAEIRSLAISSGYAQYLRRTELSLLGDPTLRESYVQPATNLDIELEEQSQSTARAATLSWDDSADPSVAGYYVYWSANEFGSYDLLDDGDSDSNGMVEGTSFTDTDPDHLAGFYMVRASKLEETPSGTYWNLSTGVIAASVAHYATFQWDDSPQSIAVAMASGIPMDDTNTDVIVTISDERYDHATSSFVSTTFAAGTDFSLDVLPPYDPLPDGTAIGWVLQINILTTSDAGVANVLPSGHYTVAVSYGGRTFTKQIIFASGDTNGDGIVNFTDLVTLTGHYNTTVGEDRSFGVGDFDDDGDVDFNDLVILGANYGLAM